MKRVGLHLILLAFCISSFPVLMAQGIPSGFNYQGRLFDPEANLGLGAPVTGEQSVVFRLYDDGVNGNLVWSRRMTVFCNDNGEFNLVVSDAGQAVAGEPTTPLIEVLPEYVTLYLGMQVGEEPEIETLQQLVTTPYAQIADKAGTAVTSERAVRTEGTAVPPVVVGSAQGGFEVEQVSDGNVLRMDPAVIEAEGDLNLNTRSDQPVTVGGRLTYEGSILGPMEPRNAGNHTETHDGFVFVRFRNRSITISHGIISITSDRRISSGSDTDEDDGCLVIPVYKGVSYTVNVGTSTTAGGFAQFHYRAIGK